MISERLEIRLDPERRRQLVSIAQQRGVSISDLIRELIDRAVDDAGWEERREAVRKIAEAQVEDVPDPEELSRQLDETYALPDLY